MSEDDYIPSNSITNAEKISVANLEFYQLTGASGPAIFNSTTGDMTLTHTRYEANSGKGMGGAVFNLGKMTFVAGAEFSGNMSVYGGGAIFNADGATLKVTNGEFTGNSSEASGGAMETWGTTTLTSVTFTSNSAEHGGAIANMESKNTLTISGCTFTGNTAVSTTDFGGGAISNQGTITVNNSVFSGNSALHGGAIYNLSNGTMTLTNVSFKKATDSIINDGKMTFSGNISLSGNLETESVIKASGVALTFDISEYTAVTSTAILEDFTKLSGVASYSLKVCVSQCQGTYTLAKNAATFNTSIVLKDTSGIALGTLSVGSSVSYDGGTYTLTRENNMLQLTVVQKISGNQNGQSWQAVEGATHYEVNYSQDGFASWYSVQVADTSLSTYGLSNGTWQWRVRALDGEDTSWLNGHDFISDHDSSASTALSAEDDGTLDVFFADAGSVWSDGYMAQNQGSTTTDGTKDVAVLAGKNRFADLFHGSDDTNILFLTDDANGDALFIDDIYTQLPDAAAASQPRLSRIQEIRAGKGNDLVDLTSSTVEYVGGGVKVYGEDGDDTIWANSGSNWLYGDNGNDRLVGGSGDDVIIGGTGNDSLHGGGGNDVFCFGAAWGTDTVEQFNGGSVTLWFASGSLSNWNAETATYKDGDNTVTVSGVSANAITLYFGESDGQGRYATLAAAGCFN